MAVHDRKAEPGLFDASDPSTYHPSKVQEALEDPAVTQEALQEIERLAAAYKAEVEREVAAAAVSCSNLQNPEHRQKAVRLCQFWRGWWHADEAIRYVKVKKVSQAGPVVFQHPPWPSVLAEQAPTDKRLEPLLKITGWNAKELSAVPLPESTEDQTLSISAAASTATTTPGASSKQAFWGPGGRVRVAQQDVETLPGKFETAEQELQATASFFGVPLEQARQGVEQDRIAAAGDSGTSSRAQGRKKMSAKGKDKGKGKERQVSEDEESQAEEESQGSQEVHQSEDEESQAEEQSQGE